MKFKARGLSRSKDYRTWWDMLERCRNSNRKDFKHYGGRGIKVCKRWRNSFLNFVDDMGRKPSGMTLDRRNNNQGYSPNNCRWITTLEQNRNRSSNRILRFNGKSACVTEWAQNIGIPKDTLNSRLRRGWSVNKSLSTKLHA